MSQELPNPEEHIPGITDDPVLRLIYTGQAETLDEAEEKHPAAAWPELLDLLRQPLTNEELERHPLMALLRSRSTRGWEDSLL